MRESYEQMLGKCDVSTCTHIQTISRHFCSTSDLKCFDWQVLFQHLSDLEFDESESHQNEILNLTVENPLVLKYPVRREYQLAFLKNYITQTENFNIPFSRAYELYVTLLNSNSSGEKTNYKHYFIGKEVLSLKENNNLISSGTTGLCTWEAGIALANWCLSHSELLCSKQVLELGCGSGLTGIAVIKSGLPLKKYIFTDFHPLVLEQLKHNLDINIPGESWPRDLNETEVDVYEFNWENITDNLLNKFKEADTILAADVVFDKVLIGALCKVLEKLLDSSLKRAVLACTVRNQDTLDYFINTIKLRGLNLIEDNSSYPAVIEKKTSSLVNNGRNIERLLWDLLSLLNDEEELRKSLSNIEDLEKEDEDNEDSVYKMNDEEADAFSFSPSPREGRERIKEAELSSDRPLSSGCYPITKKKRLKISKDYTEEIIKLTEAKLKAILDDKFYTYGKYINYAR